MKKAVLILLNVSLLVSCITSKEVAIETVEVETSEDDVINKINHYVNGIDSYVYHINASSKDVDSISSDELLSFKNSHHITKSITEKNTTLYKNRIVKVKHRDYFENNFVKLKSFYYDEDNLVCVKIYEIFPSRKENEGRIYKRNLYYHENELILDSKETDSKYETNELLSLGVEQLKEEYQSQLE